MIEYKRRKRPGATLRFIVGLGAIAVAWFATGELWVVVLMLLIGGAYFVYGD